MNGKLIGTIIVGLLMLLAINMAFDYASRQMCTCDTDIECETECGGEVSFFDQDGR